MFRKACLAALVVALLAPALPALADDGDWSLPDVGAWFLGLFDLDSVTIEVAKNGGDAGNEPPPEDSTDPETEPGDEGGIFIDPSG